MTGQNKDNFSYEILSKVDIKNGKVDSYERERGASGSKPPKLFGISLDTSEKPLVGQYLALCNSAIQGLWEVRKNKGGIVYYIKVSYMLANTSFNSEDECVEFIERYLVELSKTGVFDNMYCIGVIDPSSDKKIVPNGKGLLLRYNEVLGMASATRGSDKRNSEMCAEPKHNCKSKKETYIGVVQRFNTKSFKIVSRKHQLAHAMVIRYLYYSRYVGIAEEFVAIMDTIEDVNPLDAFCLAHYGRKGTNIYEPYYAIMPMMDIMSRPSYADIISRLHSGDSVNNAFTTSPKSARQTKVDTWGKPYDSVAVEGDTAKASTKLKSLMKKGSYEKALALYTSYK